MVFDIRHQYVLSRQIAAHGNFSPFIMECFEKTPRSFFLPEPLTPKAYMEDFIELSEDRMVMSPLSLARLLARLPLVPEKNIMIIGGSTGYSAALLSYYASTVFLLESDDRFAPVAQAGLSALHMDNVVLCQGPLKEGLGRQSPFEFIVVEGAVDYIPVCFFDQLTEQSPGVFACLSSGLPIGQMTRFFKDKRGVINKEELFEMPCFPSSVFMTPKQFKF